MTVDRGKAGATVHRESQIAAPSPFDALPPARMAALVAEVGVAKAGMPLLRMLVLAILAGAFIAFGGMLSTVVQTGSTLGWGPTRLLGGLAFSLGLALVVVGGAELFTGNNLIVMAWASRKVTTGQILRNWAVVFAGNVVGALGTAALMAASGLLDPAGPAAATARSIAVAKLAIGPFEAFARGVLCNVLVCLALWLCFAARSVADKLLAIPLPIAAFVALGFEHSIANLYLLPAGWIAGQETVSVAAALANIVPVTLGNMVGGGVLVAAVYWLVWLRADSKREAA